MACLLPIAVPRALCAPAADARAAFAQDCLWHGKTYKKIWCAAAVNPPAARQIVKYFSQPQPTSIETLHQGTLKFLGPQGLSFEAFRGRGCEIGFRVLIRLPVLLHGHMRGMNALNLLLADLKAPIPPLVPTYELLSKQSCSRVLS